jgi:hypothetical protein
MTKRAHQLACSGVRNLAAMRPRVPLTSLKTCSMSKPARASWQLPGPDFHRQAATGWLTDTKGPQWR